MGDYSFGHYKEPCPNCGGIVKVSWFAGDYYTDGGSSIACSKCGATFEQKKWEAFNEEKHGKDYYVRDGGSGRVYT